MLSNFVDLSVQLEDFGAFLKIQQKKVVFVIYKSNFGGRKSKKYWHGAQNVKKKERVGVISERDGT